MKTLVQTQNTQNSTKLRILQSLLIIAACLIASDVYSQSKEVQFNVYTHSTVDATQYLLGNDVALRDCPAAQCEQLTTIKVGTRVRLLDKSETPQTIGGVTSRWYQVKMGPQIGWIWGGLIAQKALVSNSNPAIKFLVGEAGYDYKGNKLYQIRAVINGKQLDKIIFKTEKLNREELVVSSKGDSEIIDISTKIDGKVTDPLYIIFKDNRLKKTNKLPDLEKSLTQLSNSFVSCMED